MKTKLNVFMALFLMTVFLVPLSSQAEEWVVYTGKSIKNTKNVFKRQPYNWGMGLGGGIFEGVGVHGVFFPVKGLSLDLGVGTFLFSNNIALGVKHFFTPDTAWSFYGFGKSAYVRFGRWWFDEESRKYLGFSAGPGIQYMHRSGFAVSLEAGPGVFFKLGRNHFIHKADFVPQAGLNFSWYF